MLDYINSSLESIEKEQSCSILFACESGSRAWGFASPDSDFDVRFVYFKPIDWFLRIDSKIDSITEMLPHDLDLSGWELQKALRLFAKSNIALYEWFGSPIIYCKNDYFFKTVKSLIPLYFNPKKAIHHYHSIADTMLKEHLQSHSVNIKKLFYILRPLLACMWIVQYKTMPPTVFDELLIEHEYLSKIHLSFIGDLLLQKNVTSEQGTIEISQNILDWINLMMIEMALLAQNVETKTSIDLAPLNEIMLEIYSRKT
jgi:predicted nucleotidyltransferase